MKPWKSFLTPRQTTPPEQLQWGHGDEAVEEEVIRAHQAPPCCCFNGATAMKPWKRPCCAIRVTKTRWLQWGHGDEAVEEVRDG